MSAVFLILGYGIPKNILKDDNYRFYLSMVFNKIYSIVVSHKYKKCLLIFSGGKTDTFKPCKRNEADEMIKFFCDLIQQKPFLRHITKRWIFIPEREALSTLENLLNSKKIIQRRKIKPASLFIFCEQTRVRRVRSIARKIFVRGYGCKIMPIDFDISTNRYLPPKFLAKKEQKEIKDSLWALQGAKHLRQHHNQFAERINYLRKDGTNSHAEAVNKWWKQKYNL